MNHKDILSAAISSSVRKGGSWLGKLSVSQTKEVELLRNAYNKLSVSERPSVMALRKVLIDEFGITIGKDSFREWLKSQDSSSVQLSKSSKPAKKAQMKGKNVGKG